MIIENICSLCGGYMEPWPGGGGFGHNARPLGDGRCCDWCNGNLVIPVRIRIIGLKRSRQGVRSDDDQGR